LCFGQEILVSADYLNGKGANKIEIKGGVLKEEGRIWKLNLFRFAPQPRYVLQAYNAVYLASDSVHDLPKFRILQLKKLNDSYLHIKYDVINDTKID